MVVFILVTSDRFVHVVILSKELCMESCRDGYVMCKANIVDVMFLFMLCAFLMRFTFGNYFLFGSYFICTYTIYMYNICM